MSATDRLEFYAIAGGLIAGIVGPLFLVVGLARRICKTRSWPSVSALGCGLLFSLVTLAPYARFGSGWAAAWMYLTLPFSLPLEYLAPLGFTVFVLVTTAIAASFWAVAVYVVAAGVLLLRRG